MIDEALKRDPVILMIHSLTTQLVTGSETLGRVKNINFDGKRQIVWRRLYVSLASELGELRLLKRTIVVSTSLMVLRHLETTECGKSPTWVFAATLLVHYPKDIVIWSR